MNVLVNGIGNIGTTVLEVLNRYKQELGIDKLYALKNKPMPWHISDLEALESKGIIVCTREDDEFTHLDTVLGSINYVFDCTNNGGGIKNKEWYELLPNLKGACAQGSEKAFGTSFMTGINDSIVQGEKYVHIVSCNTHSIASLLTTFCGHDLAQLKQADFVIVRRSEDLGNHQRLVSANVVARHLDSQLGTHHSIDVLDLFKTKGQHFKVSSSDVTTPSQLMHGVRFNIELKQPLREGELKTSISKNKFAAHSNRFDSNIIFERGRRYGFQGRIYSHTVIISNNILQVDNNLMGWAFIPQEGNTILSTIHAYLLQTENKDAQRLIDMLADDLLQKQW